jgi:Domain of unknown function (DUF4337)
MNHEGPHVSVSGGNRIVSLAAAILAVLAALGTLFAHHRSISALSVKNQAILAQARATDSYNSYEAKEIRYNIYQALLASRLVTNPESRARLKSVADREQVTSPSVLAKARRLEDQAAKDDDRSEAFLKSYERLQFAATAFQIAIVFVSISALAGGRFLLPAGFLLSGLGLVLFVTGLLQAR